MLEHGKVQVEPESKFSSTPKILSLCCIKIIQNGTHELSHKKKLLEVGYKKKKSDSLQTCLKSIVKSLMHPSM